MSSPNRSVSHEVHSLPGDITAPLDASADKNPEDFVSFPTLPDPEVIANRSFSTIITKTLRKVTNNASNLVHNYTAATGGNEQNTPEILDSSSLLSHGHPIDPSTDSLKHDTPPVENANRADIPPLSQSQMSPKSTRKEPVLANPSLLSPPINLLPVATAPPIVTTLVSDSNSSRRNVVSETRVNGQSSSVSADNLPRVTSDNYKLKVATTSASKGPTASLNTNDINAPASLEASYSNKDARMSSVRLSQGSLAQQDLPKANSAPTSRNSTVKTLQNRISSIFNNLPNDIEVSDDDSASDGDTEDHVSQNSSVPVLDNGGVSFLGEQQQRTPVVLRAQTGVSDSAIKTSPKQRRAASRRISGHFPSAILDGAKSIIQTNLGSSASSVRDTKEDKKAKKKKPRPQKLSNNPLKNGGIPKKYWMDDSFVSDCLNCFKQFTAFRRKHHCRFCGQIFCSDCTIFISYSQYKEQRQGKDSGKVAKSFKDKLRVCKPCYSDVVVYLSDDSSSSSGEEEADKIYEQSPTKVSDNLVLEDYEADSIPETIAARLRSYSATSSKSSVIPNSPISKTNRTPLSGQRDSPRLKIESPRTSESAQKSPDVSHRHPPQMAIPTRRAGEAVEIAIPSGSYTQSSSLHSHQTLRSSGHGMLSLKPKADEGPDSKSWYRNYPRRSASVSSEMGNRKGLENISSFYKSVVNGNFTKLPTKSKLDFTKRNHNTQIPAQTSATEPDDDVESENEDEKVMSLYTSLNHSAGAAGMATRPLSHLTSSMNSVPTLLDFPGIEGKYIPANNEQSNAMARFEFKPIDSVNSSTMTENRQRSNFRSNERAKASMRRIKDRRHQKSLKKTRGVASLIPSFPSDFNNEMSASSELSTKIPVQSTPDSSHTDIEGSFEQTSPHKELRSNLSSFSIKAGFEKLSAKSSRTNDEHSVSIAYPEQLTGADTTEVVNTSAEISIHSMFDHTLKLLVRQCLEDCDIKEVAEQTRWVKILSKLFASIHRIKVTDTLDVKQYIKIKKILGGKLEDTSIFEGLFITKDVDSKRMTSPIDNPKIALLVFPLEYLKHKEQFISLRVVKSQQSVYISNLISRLISLGPDIVVVGDTVCGLAKTLLEEASITVISNVKPQVIERISRYTKADIFQSVNDLFFKKGSLGECDRFEVKRFVYGDLVKTYSYFLGSDLESGFTVCLRGGDEEYLSSVKYASETLIPGVFNSRFELSFFLDFSLIVDPTVDKQSNVELDDLEDKMRIQGDNPEDLKTICVRSMEHFGVVNYVRLFNERVLSYSPSVSFPLPSILGNVIESFKTFVDAYDLDNKVQGLSEAGEIDPQWLEDLSFRLNSDRFNGKSDLLTFLKFVSSERVLFQQRKFNFRMRIWSNSMKSSIYQLYPIFHRSIHFLHSRVSIKHATPCYGPAVVVVDFYSDNDKCLGTFLHQTLQEAGKPCEECGDLMLNHYKTYVHGKYKIDLIVEKIDDAQILEQFTGKSSRIMWSYCPECNVSSPVSNMSDDTFYLSLGKFFELNFWSRQTKHEGLCEHDFFKSQVKYFGILGYFIRIEISDVLTYEVVVPRKRLEFVAVLSLESKLDALKTIQESTAKFFQSILNRLDRIKVDTFDKAEEGYDMIKQLKEKVASDEEAIATKTLSIYQSTLSTNYMSLNVIQRDIQGLGVSWDKEFNEFEKRFLPTENEITKITQFHLKNFLMDRLDSELKDDRKIPRDSEPKTSGTKSELSQLKSNIESVSPLQPSNSSQDRIAVYDDPFSIGSRRLPSTAIEDKINQMRQSLEEGSSKHILKSPSRSRAEIESEPSSNEVNGQSAPKRVQDLTNYFNQMTLEFQKQREAVLERQSSKYKAIPIVKSQPIVEIYDNIEDVVDVGRKQTTTVKDHASRSKDHEAVENDSDSQKQHQSLSVYHERKVSSSSNAQFSDEKEGGEARVEIPQPEKNSLLKSLSNFWADRSATLWDPLEYPLDFTEHTFADSEVIVREDEPCSLVAFCLSSGDYRSKISGMGTNETDASEDKESETLEISEQFKKKSDHFAKLERKFKKRNDQAKREDSNLEVSMNKVKSSHLKYQFVDGSTEMSCKIFYSEQFDALRKACGVDDSFIQSLSRCVKWNSTGGKSGSSFLKTLDNRYIIKELSKSELESFVSIAPFYFKYISQSTFNTLTTALAKIFGFYQVEFKNSMNGKTFRMDFLIMENLFYNRKTTRIFDLKGSMRNRHVKQTGKENEVLLDENMIEFIYESPVFVNEQSKKLLRGCLFNDTSFLSAMDVMDYSLVIGIDDSSAKLYVGIIDWLRTFTWDKKVENWVKGKTLVNKKGKDPTIVTPKQYRTRFREAMDRYILEVPDIWYEGSN